MGRIVIYEWIDETWTNVLYPDLYGEATGDQFGFSLDLTPDGSRFVAGSKFNSENGTHAGHVRVFDIETINSVVDPTSEDQIKIFPNPTFGKFELTGVDFESVKVMDRLGRIVMYVENSVNEIDISHLQSGIYFIQINIKNNFVFKKITKL